MLHDARRRDSRVANNPDSTQPRSTASQTLDTEASKRAPTARGPRGCGNTTAGWTATNIRSCSTVLWARRTVLLSGVTALRGGSEISLLCPSHVRQGSERTHVALHCEAWTASAHSRMDRLGHSRHFAIIYFKFLPHAKQYHET